MYLFTFGETDELCVKKILQAPNISVPIPFSFMMNFFKLHTGYGRWEYTVTSSISIKNEYFLNQNNFPFLFIPSFVIPSYCMSSTYRNYYSSKEKKNPILNRKITFYLGLKASVGKIHKNICTCVLWVSSPSKPFPAQPLPTPDPSMQTLFHLYRQI